MPFRPQFHRSPMQDLVDAQRRDLTTMRYGADWKRARRAHLLEFPLCIFCGRIASLVDHITPIDVDPTRRLDRMNLRSCCVDCHAVISTQFRMTGINEWPADKLTPLQIEQRQSAGSSKITEAPVGGEISGQDRHATSTRPFIENSRVIDPHGGHRKPR